MPAVANELIKAGKIRKDALTVNGKTLYENCKNTPVEDPQVIWPYKKPMKKHAGFLNLKGNLFDSAIMKTSVISDDFRKRYLSNRKDPNAWEGRAIVFEGPEDYHHRIDDPKLKIDENCMLFVRGTGPVGYPGAAEVVNMQPPGELIKHGVTELPCIGDGRQSGTSGSPSILNASPVGRWPAIIAFNAKDAKERDGELARVDQCAPIKYRPDPRALSWPTPHSRRARAATLSGTPTTTASDMGSSCVRRPNGRGVVGSNMFGRGPEAASPRERSATSCLSMACRTSWALGSMTKRSRSRN